MDVNCIQINFADDGIKAKIPEGAQCLVAHEIRYIDREKRRTRWILEGSLDGGDFFVIEDKSKADTNLCNDFVYRPEGIKARFIRLTVIEVPFDQNICVSGIRVFGKGNGRMPAKTAGVKAVMKTDIDMQVSWNKDNAAGHNIVWGYAPTKLYHSYLVLGRDSQNIGAIVKDSPIYVRVDSFNETGITHGDVIKIR